MIKLSSCNCLTCWLVLLYCSMVCAQQQQQQLSDKFERVFKGEGVLCKDTYAQVDIQSQTVKSSNQSLITAISQTFTQYIENIQDGEGREQAVIDAAQSGSKLILEVIAEAVANVSAQINSPDRGCWAIAYGRAEAVAIAEATINAVAEAFAEASYSGRIIFADEFVENVVYDLQVAVEEVAVYLADGSGDGLQSQKASVSAKSKATAVNCALARAFSRINKDGQEVIGLAEVGCIEEQIEVLEYEHGFQFNCGCQVYGEFGAPNFCGKYGDQETGDTICYVDLKYGPCLCALPSIKYPGAFWRYCGETLKNMQQLLKMDQAPFFPVEYGYCSSWDVKIDEELNLFAAYFKN